MRYYDCKFLIFRDGCTNTRPREKHRFVMAENSTKAYQKAQRICSSALIAESPDLCICRHKDIRPVLVKDARMEIGKNPSLLIDISEEPSAPIKHVYMGHKIIEYADHSFLATKLRQGEIMSDVSTSLKSAKRFIRK